MKTTEQRRAAAGVPSARAPTTNSSLEMTSRPGPARTSASDTSTHPRLSTPTMADDRYELIDELGRGFFGVVHHARQLHLDRHCAVKLIRGRTDPACVLERPACSVRCPNTTMSSRCSMRACGRLTTSSSLPSCVAAVPLKPSPQRGRLTRVAPLTSFPKHAAVWPTRTTMTCCTSTSGRPTS